MPKTKVILKTPPPYGGGELLALALRDHIAPLPDFDVLEVKGQGRDKTNQGRFSLWKFKEFLNTWWQVFWTVVGKHRPDVIALPLGKSFPHFVRDSLLMWTAWSFQVPCAAELHGVCFHFLGKGWFQTWYGRLVLRRLVSLRVLGKSIARDLATHGISNTVVIDNGIKPVFWKAAAVASVSPPRFLFVGTHSPQKGFDQLLVAANAVAEKGCDFEIHTMGEWISEHFRDKMMGYLRDQALDSRICFHGLKHGAEKWEVFSQCAVLVLPSMSEGQPLVILEALACGMPVVATNVGAVPDTIENGVNGLLLDPGDVTALSRAMETVLSDARLSDIISQENVRLYETRFTEEEYLRNEVAWLRACARRETWNNDHVNMPTDVA